MQLENYRSAEPFSATVPSGALGVVLRSSIREESEAFTCLCACCAFSVARLEFLNVVGDDAESCP